MSWNGVERRARERALEALIAKAVETGSRKVAEDVVRTTVPTVINETLKGFGVNADNPISVQRHMQYLREAAARASDPEVIADREFIRQTRLRCERFWNRFYDTVFGTLTRWSLAVALFGCAVWLEADFGLLSRLAD